MNKNLKLQLGKACILVNLLPGVNLLAQNFFTEKGVFPPELVGKHKNCFDFVLNYLKERKVNWIKKEY